MKQYLEKVTGLLKSFKHFIITMIPQLSYAQADKLSKLAFDSLVQLGRALIVDELTSPAVEKQVNLVAEIEEPENCWMIPFLKYLTEGSLP